MNKSELIKAIAEKAGMPATQADKAWNATVEVIAETLKAGDKITVPGFGTFDAKERSARTGVNPKTGEKIQIPASVVPSFKAGKGFKDQLAK